MHRRAALATFPYGTLAVNMLGCLLIGILASLMESRQLFSFELRRFALVGFLGGFTTYSTFSYETFLMIREAEPLRAAANIGLHVVLGLALVWAGYSLAMSRQGEAVSRFHPYRIMHRARERGLVLAKIISSRRLA